MKRLWRWMFGPIDRAIMRYAFGKIEQRGLCICRIEHRAGTNYLIDINGIAHKIGKRA